MTEKPPQKEQKKIKTAVVHKVAMEHYRHIRAGMDQALLDNVAQVVRRSMGESVPFPEVSREAEQTEARRKTFETILKFMTLSKGGKAFMQEVAASIASAQSRKDV
ncbi:MAG: hypothetical protein J0L77_09245 [Alphaproteobacteria bacterium]|nr:hypothetical protein [Alphaproteobacteria bacterium]